MKYRLKDKTHVDCLVDTHSIEVDFAKKWAESITQSLYYASKTSPNPAVILIIEDAKRYQKYLNKLENVSQSHHIDIWIITKDFEIIQR
ncbi:MAG TPA: hypothetical protein EYO73_06950 [Sulfurimonas sp.]|nr:hypothetical protein [Sulfurimonas sp.]